MKSKGIDKHEAKELSQAPGEVYAAISMALHLSLIHIYNTEAFMIESLRQISSQITCANKHNRCIFYTSLHYFLTVLQTRIK